MEGTWYEFDWVGVVEGLRLVLKSVPGDGTHYWIRSPGPNGWPAALVFVPDVCDTEVGAYLSRESGTPREDMVSSERALVYYRGESHHSRRCSR